MLLPSSSYRLGLWSNVSTCDGPPYMNRKMTLFALGANGEDLGARGLVEANALCEKKPTLSSSPASATPVNPAPACQRNSRRVRPQKVLVGLRGSVDIDELVQVQREETEVL